MATNETQPAKPAKVAKAADAAKPAAGTAAKAKPAPRQCVVDDGTAHVGRAVNGSVCSRHAVNYKSDGTRR